jgi:hypothetical protein
METELRETHRKTNRLFIRAARSGGAIGFQFIVLVTLIVAGATAAMPQTGGGATLVGTVKDGTGAVVVGAKVKAVNTATNYVSETSTGSEGGYYIPYLVPGSYRITVDAPGFKGYVREGLTLMSAEVPRVDIILEVGAHAESVTVSGAAPLLNTENAVSDYVLPADVITQVSGLMKRTVYLMEYMPGIIDVQSQAGYHIDGQAQNSMGFTLDGITSKTPYNGTVNQVDGVVQASTDAMEEVKVLTAGVSAEYGHTSGGSVQAVYKSGTNSLHASFEDRYLNGAWAHRDYLTQVPVESMAPWYYETFDLVVSGPIVIPKLYNGRNKTFFLADYAINHEHTVYEETTTVPTAAMMAGNFAFPEAAALGGGLPIYDPQSTVLTNGTYTRTPFPNNQIPVSRFDPVAVKYLALGIWQPPNQPGTPSRTGPTNNLLAIESPRILYRDRWDGKIDHQFSPDHKIYFRYSQYHNRGLNGDDFAKSEFNSSQSINPVDDINGVISDTYIFSPTMFNEMRVGYNRRANSTPPRPAPPSGDSTWAAALGMPGVTAPGLPYFNIGYGIGAMNNSREVGEDHVFQENLTKIKGPHSLKMGYQMIQTWYDLKNASLPAGQYNFGGTELPFTPNTGQTFASFLLGTVTSATFTQQLAEFLPRQWGHELYVQDDWKVSPTLALNLGVRWSYSSPFSTKYGQQSQFNPNAIDPVTGLMGAITHPAGVIGKRDLNNFQPRLGLAWNFAPKFVFRASFDVFTVDSPGTGGFDEYSGTFNILQPTGNPNYLFELKDGPGPIQYAENPNGTVPYTGASYSSRTATWRDPNLRNPYVMNWTAGLQYQFARTWLMKLTYQGNAGVALERSWNINQIPLSIALGGNTTLQNTVYASQQNYLMYPQFGAINFLSNFNHSTWESGNIAIEKHYSSGLTFNTSFNFSKCLTNADNLAYYDRAGKARCSYDQREGFGALVTYALPFGRGQRWLNQGGFVNAVLGGWSVNMTENTLSGIPLSVSYSGSPYKYLTTANVNALEPIGQVAVPNWTIGQRFPTSAQNPYFNMNAFTYPAAYTTGSLGAYVLQAPAILWNQFFVSKSWRFRERYKVTLRADGHNLPWKRPNLAAPNTTYNVNSPGTFGRFTGTLGDFSNFGSAESNMQASIRVEF